MKWKQTVFQKTSLGLIRLRHYGHIWEVLIYQHVLKLGHVLPFQNLLCSTQRQMQNELWVLTMGVYLVCNPHIPAHCGHSLAKVASCVRFPNADLLLLTSIITEPHVMTICFGSSSSHRTHSPAMENYRLCKLALLRLFASKKMQRHFKSKFLIKIVRGVQASS